MPRLFNRQSTHRSAALCRLAQAAINTIRTPSELTMASYRNEYVIAYRLFHPNNQLENEIYSVLTHFALQALRTDNALLSSEISDVAIFFQTHLLAQNRMPSSNDATPPVTHLTHASLLHN